MKMRLGVHHLRTRRPPRAARNKGLLFWKSSTSIMRSRFPSLAPPSLAFRRAISRPFRLPISRLPIPRRRRSKIPAMRHFRPLPILTRSKPANQIPRIRRCARGVKRSRGDPAARSSALESSEESRNERSNLFPSSELDHSMMEVNLAVASNRGGHPERIRE